jgi:ribosome recycling factor
MADKYFADVEAKMQKCVESTRAEFASIRTGRATPALLDRLHVDAYGQSVPLKQIAGVSTPDSRTLVITAWDKAVVSEIRKAIEKSDLGLTPNVDGSVVRLIIPPLNEERRKELAKVVKKKAEDGKVAVRNVRHRAHDDIKGRLKTHAITEDDNKRMQDTLQKLTDRYVKDIDTLVAAKEKEIMEV